MVSGVEGVLQAYTDVINKVQLYGPTNFAEIINVCASMAASKKNDQTEQNYVILLMITDGVISDMEQTVNAIVRASDLPLSVIIVGVGNADFFKMERLDADDHPLIASNGQRMKRDIVQFVPFNQFKQGDIGRLAKAVLEEVPGQITGYMTMKKLAPLRNVDPKEMKQQVTTLLGDMGTYEGPSTIVREGTRFVRKINQPVNPYYAQQQPQQAPMPGYNPAMVANANAAPSAPVF